jgi:hypothetical protein
LTIILLGWQNKIKVRIYKLSRNYAEKLLRDFKLGLYIYSINRRRSKQTDNNWLERWWEGRELITISLDRRLTNNVIILDLSSPSNQIT